MFILKLDMVTKGLKLLKEISDLPLCMYFISMFFYMQVLYSFSFDILIFYNIVKAQMKYEMNSFYRIKEIGVVLFSLLSSLHYR